MERVWCKPSPVNQNGGGFIAENDYSHGCCCCILLFFTLPFLFCSISLIRQNTFTRILAWGNQALIYDRHILISIRMVKESEWWRLYCGEWLFPWLLLLHTSVPRLPFFCVLWYTIYLLRQNTYSRLWGWGKQALIYDRHILISIRMVRSLLQGIRMVEALLWRMIIRMIAVVTYFCSLLPRFLCSLVYYISLKAKHVLQIMRLREAGIDLWQTHLDEPQNGWGFMANMRGKMMSIALIAAAAYYMYRVAWFAWLWTVIVLVEKELWW